MTRLRKIIKADLDQEETDKILEKVIQAKFDADLRKDWKQKLQNDFGISKTERQKTRTLPLGRRQWLYLTTIAASVLLLVVALNLFTTSSTESAQTLALSYLENTDIYHPGVTKGIETETETARQAALEAFNAKQYPEAARLFSSIPKKTEQDRYHSALASLLSRDYDESIAKFQQMSTPATYREEINWYLSTALLLNDQEAEAKAILSSIQADEWNFENAQALLKKMK